MGSQEKTIIEQTKFGSVKSAIIFIVILFSIYLTNFYSFLLFHIIAELFSVAIAFGIFAIGWNTRKNLETSFFLLLGVSLIFIGVIDLLHTIAYTGMNIFIGYDSNLPTSLWIAARYLQAASFLIAHIYFNRKVNPNHLLIFYTIITSTLMILIFSGNFPVCYVEGFGLTPFKVISEYIIITLLILSVIALYSIKKEFNIKMLRLLFFSILTTILSELSFTFYVSVYGLSNLIGHILKIISFYCIYLSIIQKGLEDPISVLFTKLKKSEEALAIRAIDLEKAYSEVDQIFNASLPLRIIDFDGSVKNVNETFCKLFKFDSKDIIGKKCYEEMPHNFCHTENCSLRQIEKGIKRVEYEIHINRKDEKLLILIVNSVPYRSAKGEFLGIIQNYLDITDRKNIQDALTKEQEFTETALNAQTDTFFVFDPTTKKAIRWNRAFKKVTGYNDEEILSMDAPDSYYSKDDLQRAAEATRSIEAKGITTVQMNLINKDGSQIPFEYVGSSITDENGKLKYIVSVGRDITERKKAEEEIKNIAKFPSENPNPIMRVDHESVLYANSSGQMLFNISSGSEIPESFKNVMEEVFRTQLIKQVELELNKQFYSFTITPVPEKNYLNFYGLNITDRIRAEQRLQNMVSTVSHELRTPITVLMMSCDYLKQKADSLTPELEGKLMDAVSRNISLLKDLSEDILTISQVDEKKLSLELIEYSPLKLLEEILIFFNPIAKEKSISINIDMDESILLKGDERRIDQIFRILLDNAIKFSNENSTVEITAIDSYHGKYNLKGIEGVLIQFKDQGLGISNEDLPHIFERFYRASNIKKIEGTGLGLSIAKELIELHQGEINIESEIGKGTTFYIFLPKLNTLKNNV